MNLLMKLSYILIILLGYMESAEVKTNTDNQYLLPTDIVPYHYNIHFMFDVDVFYTETYTGIVEIYFEVLSHNTVHTIKLHASKLYILSVRLIVGSEQREEMKEIIIGPPPYYFDPKTNIFEIFTYYLKPLSKDNYTLIIDFQGKFNTKSMKGFYIGTYTDAGKTHKFAVTQLQPTFARNVFPCFDEPRFKATFNITTSYPNSYGLLTNTPPYREYHHTNERNIITVRHERTPKMPTYLLAILISEFSCDRGYRLLNDTSFYVCSRNETRHLRKLAIDYTPRIVRELDYTLGVSYSDSGIKKLTEIAIPSFHAGGMENWGLITFRESFVLQNESVLSNSELQSTLMLIAHEMTHQWFGNLITLESWTYLFLNEGFAEFFQFYILNKIRPSWKIEKQFPIEIVQLVLPMDSPERNSGLSTYVTQPDDISKKFSSVTYKKGGCLVRMIAHFMTMEKFLKGIKYYVYTFKYENVRAQHLWYSLNIYAELPENNTLNEIMYNWITKPGYPLINVKSHGDNITITQEPFFERNSSIEWYVPISYTLSTDKDKFANTTARAWLIPNQILNITNTSKYLDWIILNNQQTGYYRVNYDDRLWDKLSLALKQKNFSGIDALSRSQIVDDVIHMASNNRMNYRRAINLISFLKNDTDYYPWHPAIKYFSDIFPKLRQHKIEKPLKKYIFEMIYKIYTSINFMQNRTDHVYGTNSCLKELVIDFVCELNYLNCIDVAKEYYKHYKSSFIELNPNIKETIYCTSLRHTDNIMDDYNFLWHKFLNTSDEYERSILLRSLGCTRDPNRRQLLLDEIARAKPYLSNSESLILFNSIASNDLESLNDVCQYLKDKYVVIDFFLNSATLKIFINSVIDKFTTQKQIDDFSNLIDELDIKHHIKYDIKDRIEDAKTNINTNIALAKELMKYFSSAPKQNIHICVLLTLIFNHIL